MTARLCMRLVIPAVVMAVLLQGCESDKRKVQLAAIPLESPQITSREASSELTSDREASIASGQASPIHFTSMLQTSGISFLHESGDSADKAFPAANGSGLATLDFDMDGRYDLYFGNGTSFPIDPRRKLPADEFYRNLGDWVFQNVTKLSGLGFSEYTSGLAIGDYNDDGFPDIYVASVGTNQMYVNHGDGTFSEVSSETATDDSKWGVSAAFADLDNDGFLDLYVCNYADWDFADNRYCGDQGRGIRMYCSPTLFPPAKDILYHNRGDGAFDDDSEKFGINNPPGRAQGVIAADLNSDGLIDLYVANDISANALLINSGDGRLPNRAESTGTAFDHLGTAQASMGLAVADIDRNGLFDLFVTNYENEANALYENIGNENFLESGSMRIPDGSLPYVGWGTALSDFDLDGWPDLIVTNGHTDNNLSQFGKEGRYLQPPGVWHNRNGMFSLVTKDCGAYFEQLHCGRALVTVDLDNDGDPDVVIGHQDNQPALLRNDTRDSNSVVVRLIGRSDNRTAIGSVIESISEDLPACQVIYGGGSYASASDQRLIFPAHGNSKNIDLRIRWPNGTRSLVRSIRQGGAYVLVQPSLSEQPTLCLEIPVQ